MQKVRLVPKNGWQALCLHGQTIPSTVRNVWDHVELVHSTTHLIALAGGSYPGVYKRAASRMRCEC